MLISSKLKNGSPWFEVHKQGLLFLRKFRNKRLRIIFNITHEKMELQQFNSLFVGQKIVQEEKKTEYNNTLSSLSISQIYQELPDNRVLIFLNAYESSEAAHLLVLGYLVASVFFYHNSQSLSEVSKLTLMLAGLKKFLTDTQVHRLQEQIKYKSGFAKKPYFMCLFNNNSQNKQQNFYQQFRQFYKYQEGKNTLNQSIDALIDYFPERSALDITNFITNQQSKTKIHKLSAEYIKNILGRQIFNFQITGSTIQNLCFQLSQIFNGNEKKSIDLVQIYDKIIKNQKIQVLDNCIQKYSNLANDLVKGLPYEMGQLLQSHSRIQKFIVQQSMQDARNCMIFSEYETIYQKLTKVIQKKFKQMKDINKQLLRNKILNSYETIEENQDLRQHLNNLTDDNIVTITEIMEQKIGMFVEENIQDFNIQDLLGRLINQYFQNLRQYLSQHLKIKSETGGQLIQKINKLSLQNKTLQSKCRQLENQFIYLSEVNNQFKQKLLLHQPNHGINNSSAIQTPDSQLVLDMKKKIMDMQIQLVERNRTIQNLSSILDKFQVQFNRKYYKPKFNKDTQNLLSQVSSKINDLFTLFNQLKKTQNYYKDIHAEFEKKKKLIDKQRLNQVQQKNQMKQKINQATKERRIIQQTLEQARSTIHIMKNVEKESKEGINSLQNGCSKLKCFLAETQNELQNYKKALQLVAVYNTTGKSQKLRDFIKVTNQQQLKQILKSILKK